MYKIVYLFLFVFCASYSQVDSSKVLAVFQWPSVSHHVVFRHLTEELAERGHEVTVITTDAAFPKGQAPPNLNEIDLHDISYKIWQKVMVKAVKEKLDFVGRLRIIGKALNEIIEAQLRSVEVQKLLNETKGFDLIIIEACLRESLIFSHFYKVPVIQMSSFGSMTDNNYAMGIPTHPLLYPTVLSGKNYNHTMIEKIKEYYEFYVMQWYFGGELVQNEDKMLQSIFGPDIPSVTDLYKNVDMLFLNTHSLWASNVPVPSNVVYIWGIHKKPEKHLPEKLQTFLDLSKHGVIYMSFGTNTPPSALPAETIQAFVKAFSELPYDVLWKWDQDELPGRTDNIKIKKWFPQSDLLRHPKIKLFVTHCGLQSTDESIVAGVPLVGIPFRADQFFNAEKYLQFKIGVKLNINTMTADDFKIAVETVIGDSSYRQNIIKLRDVMLDEPESALERAVWWTEYVLRYKGAKHLRAAGANFPWTEYYEIKLVFIIILGIASGGVAIFISIKWIVVALRSRSKIKHD